MVMGRFFPWAPPRQQGGLGDHTALTKTRVASACATHPMQNWSFASSLAMRLSATGSWGTTKCKLRWFFARQSSLSLSDQHHQHSPTINFYYKELSSISLSCLLKSYIIFITNNGNTLSKLSPNSKLKLIGNTFTDSTGSPIFRIYFDACYIIIEINNKEYIQYTLIYITVTSQLQHRLFGQPGSTVLSTFAKTPLITSENRKVSQSQY